MLWQLAFMACVVQYTLTRTWDRHHALPPRDAQDLMFHAFAN